MLIIVEVNLRLIFFGFIYASLGKHLDTAADFFANSIIL